MDTTTNIHCERGYFTENLSEFFWLEVAHTVEGEALSRFIGTRGRLNIACFVLNSGERQMFWREAIECRLCVECGFVGKRTGAIHGVDALER